MTPEDLAELRKIAPELRVLSQVGVLSPLREAELRVFPTATSLSRRRWDLNRPTHRRVDLLVAANVFMYSLDPKLWFRNVLSACRYFLMIDLVRGRRSLLSELGNYGDSVRYAVGVIRPRIPAIFDPGSLGERVLGLRTFAGGADEYDPEPIHLIALVRGDIASDALATDAKMAQIFADEDTTGQAVPDEQRVMF